MSDESTSEIEASDFSILSVDGAYMNFKYEYIRLFLYRDVSLPQRMGDGSVKFGESRHEVLQGVRMPYEAADTLRYNLDIGLPLYTTRIKSTVSESIRQLLKSTLVKQGRFI
jgi:hypothetical protein